MRLGEQGMVRVKYTGRSKRVREWCGPFTGHPYEFGGERLFGRIDRRDWNVWGGEKRGKGPFREA